MSIKNHHCDSPEELLSALKKLSSMQIEVLCDEIKKLDYDEFSSLFSKDIRSNLYEEMRIGPIFKKIKLTLYRGEHDSSWNYSSSAERSGLKPEMLRVAQYCLLSILSDMCWYKEGMEFKINKKKFVMNDNQVAISQHYGIPTNYIDFTLDPEIAFFFACSGNDKSSYKCDYGRIYVYETTLYDIMYGGMTEGVIQYSLLSRPYNQKGFLLKDSTSRASDSLKSYTFNHSIEFSERICKKYDFGKKLIGTNHDNVLEIISKGLLTVLNCINQSITYSNEELNRICYFFINLISNCSMFVEFLSMGPLQCRYYDGNIEQFYMMFKNCEVSLNSLYDFLSLSKFERLLFDKIIYFTRIY